MLIKQDGCKIEVLEELVEIIAKGTTDPRVEFILPKSYRNLDRISSSES